MSDLRRAAEKAVAAWNQYRTAESLRGWMEILEAALEQPEWQGLTDEEIDNITTKQWGRDFMVPAAGRAWGRAIEAALKEKNA